MTSHSVPGDVVTEALVVVVVVVVVDGVVMLG